jgi:hypothetical protein
MKNIRENCFAFLNNDEFKREIRYFIHPIVNILYNEIYIYIWFICIYSVLLLVLTLGNLFLLLQIFYKNSSFFPSFSSTFFHIPLPSFSSAVHSNE